MLMYEVPDADMMKYEILSHLSVVKRGYDSIYNQVEVVQCSLHNLKIACQWGCVILGTPFFYLSLWRLTSAFLRCSCRWLWTACTAIARTGRCNPHVLRVVTMRVYAEQLFFLSISRNKFNIKRALSAHQSLTLLQKIDSHEGLFRCKKGWYVNVGKMNIYLKSPPFALFSGLFGAKWSAFWC